MLYTPTTRVSHAVSFLIECFIESIIYRLFSSCATHSACSVISPTLAHTHTEPLMRNENFKCEYNLSYTISKSLIVRVAFRRIGTSGSYDITKLLRDSTNIRRMLQRRSGFLVNVFRTSYGFCIVVPTRLPCERTQLEISKDTRSYSETRRLLDLRRALLISMTDGRYAILRRLKSSCNELTHYESELPC